MQNSELLYRKKCVGRFVIIYFLQYIIQFQLSHISEAAPPFLTYVPKKHLPGISFSLPVFHQHFIIFLVVPLMLVSLFPSDPRVLI